MPLIRNKQAEHITHRAVALELDDVRAEACALIESARAEAAKIVSEALAAAKQQRESIFEAARAEGERVGYEKGFEAGRSEAMEKVLAESLGPYRELLDRLAPVWAEELERFGQERERLMEEARREVLTFAMEIARRVVHRTIGTDESVCVDQVAEAVRLIGRPTQLRISIAPEDRDVLERALPGVLQAANLACDVEVVEDTEISRGGCRLWTQEGAVDATIETQLSRIAEALVPGGDS